VAAYDWVVFTSANAVERFLTLVPDARSLGSAKVAAIGPGTAEALARFGIRPDVVPDRFVAESLLDGFPGGPGRVLLPRAADAREVLPDGLAAKGWQVDVVEAYRTVAGSPAPAALDGAAQADAITFTSSSTLTNYLEVAGAGRVPPVVVCIGPVTAETATAAGLTVDAVADQHTID